MWLFKKSTRKLAVFGLVDRRIEEKGVGTAGASVRVRPSGQVRSRSLGPCTQSRQRSHPAARCSDVFEERKRRGSCGGRLTGSRIWPPHARDAVPLP
jgi:hypothetical protein